MEVFEKGTITLFRIIENFVVRQNFNIAASILVIDEVAFIVRHFSEISVFGYGTNARCKAAKNIRIEWNGADG